MTLDVNTHVGSESTYDDSTQNFTLFQLHNPSVGFCGAMVLVGLITLLLLYYCYRKRQQRNRRRHHEVGRDYERGRQLALTWQGETDGDDRNTKGDKMSRRRSSSGKGRSGFRSKSDDAELSAMFDGVVGRPRN